MTKFIEINLEGAVHLINTNIIEFVIVRGGKTTLQLIGNNSTGKVSIEVEDTFAEIKTKISQ